MARSPQFATRVALIGTLWAAMSCAAALAQDSPTLVRLADFKQGASVSEQTCTIVYIDSKYRVEKVLRRMGDPPAVQVFEATLDTEQMKKVIQLVNAPAFVALRPPEIRTHSLVLEDTYQLEVTVPRAGGMQDLSYPTAESRKGTDNTIGPLLAWWKDLRKHLPAPLPQGTRTRCLPGSAATTPRTQ